jgi:hypothetical protein
MNDGNKKTAFFTASFVILFSVMALRLGLEMADDAAFFLRYSENMARGEFWVWNVGETPVWGASAPLYPVLIAVPIALGVPPVQALIGTGMVLGSLSLAFVALLLANRFGYAAGWAFIAFASLDTGMMYFLGAGLETPLTIALLALGVWILLDNPRTWIVGIVAGLLMVQKLDLAPVGALLLVAHWLKEKKFPLSASIIAAAIALAWYGFAWIYFGAPAPNSFLTKTLYQNNVPKSIDWKWFGGFVLFLGIHKWFLGFSLVAFLRHAKKFMPLFLFLGGMLATHVAAYTLKYPFEPYNWYCMPSVFALLVLGAIGVPSTVELLEMRFPRIRYRHLAEIGLVVTVFAVSVKTEIRTTENIRFVGGNQEYDRAEAGRWVRDNTPKDFKVFTLWGNPAYYCQRHVYDGSFLNRPFENADLIQKYRPEILILQNNPGSTPMNPVFAFTNGEGYQIVKVFDRSFGYGLDYFFVVLAREDVIDRISNVELPANLMRYAHKVQLGDTCGVMNVRDRKTLFVHPGLTTPTRFEFDADAYGHDCKKRNMAIESSIASNVPDAAVKRGGAVVKMTITKAGKLVAEAVVKAGAPFGTTLPIEPNAAYEIVVDNYNGPDTDWFLISIQ